MKTTIANQRILDAARKYEGVCEVPGPKSNKLIMGWIKRAASWLGDDVGNDDGKVAWCGCFRGDLGHETATGTPNAYYRAVNWISWGQHVDVGGTGIWLPGDTIIMKRPGGYHVTLFLKLKPGGRMECLGGNQGDGVKVSTFAVKDVVSVRRAVM